jgi:Protein of unknown function (DUF1593).
MKLLHIIAIGLSAALFCSFAPVQEDGVYVKPRVIVTCDPELDDNNSMVRYLLHANDFQTEGLIYTSSRFHWRGDGTGKTQFKKGSEYDQMGLGPQTSWRYKWDERFIDDIVDAYTECYKNLKVHDLSYPTPEYLKSIVKVGNVDFEGDISKDTPGSELIKKVFLDDKPGKVYAQAWGGGASVGRALKSIEDQYKGTERWDAIYKKICNKVVLCFSGDQDEVYRDYIGVVWKDIPFLCARSSDRYDNSQYNFYREPEWAAANLRIGPIGARVRCWGDGKQMCPYDLTDYMGLSGYTREQLEKMGYRVWTEPQPKGTLYSDGDSGCYFNLIDNGLRAWEDDTWGGWSGRRDPSVPVDNYRPRPLGANLAPMSQAQRDSMMKAMAAMMQGGQPGQQPKENILPNFYHERMDQEAARMKWSVTPNYADANHFPIVAGPFELTARPGEKVKINAKAVDPDGDKLTIKWMQFKVGTYPGTIAIVDPSAVQVEFTVPKDAKPGQTIHMVMQATDDGEYNLVKYLRTVITVK